MLTIEQLIDRWRSLDVASHSRVDPYHPLNIYIGIDAYGIAELLLLSPFELPRIKSRKGYT